MSGISPLGWYQSSIRWYQSSIGWYQSSIVASVLNSKIFFSTQATPGIWGFWQASFALSAGHFCPLCGTFFSPKRPIFVEKSHFLLKNGFLLKKSRLNRQKSNEFLQFLVLSDTIFPVELLFCHFRPVFWGQANMLACPAYNVKKPYSIGSYQLSFSWCQPL